MSRQTTGKVKLYNEKYDWGFIEIKDSDKDVYFKLRHFTSKEECKPGHETESFKKMIDGAELLVTYDEGDKGLYCVEFKLVE